jgi:hypothetical protein
MNIISHARYGRLAPTWGKTRKIAGEEFYVFEIVPPKEGTTITVKLERPPPEHLAIRCFIDRTGASSSTVVGERPTLAIPFPEPSATERLTVFGLPLGQIVHAVGTHHRRMYWIEIRYTKTALEIEGVVLDHEGIQAAKEFLEEARHVIVPT